MTGYSQSIDKMNSRSPNRKVQFSNDIKIFKGHSKDHQSASSFNPFTTVEEHTPKSNISHNMSHSMSVHSQSSNKKGILKAEYSLMKNSLSKTTLNKNSTQSLSTKSPKKKPFTYGTIESNN